MRNSVPAGLFAVLSLGSGAWAQAPTFNTVVLNFLQADGDAYNETSVSVSRVNPNHLIVACNYQRPPFFGNFRKLYYGISTTGILGSHVSSGRSGVSSRFRQGTAGPTGSGLIR